MILWVRNYNKNSWINFRKLPIGCVTEFKELEAKRAELDKEIEVYLKELGIVE